jgi:hypothetical protein
MDKNKSIKIPSTTTQSQWSQEQEIDTGNMMSPSLFHTENVSGVLVPVTVQMQGNKLSKWKLYLNWNNGKREAIDLSNSLTLPNGQTLWFHPIPVAPALMQQVRWGCQERIQWLEGNSVLSTNDLLVKLARLFEEFIDFTDETIPYILACWTMMTYCFDIFPAIPYLWFHGQRGSGKSRCLHLLNEVAFSPVNTTSTTPSALFRTLDQQPGTILLDEAEKLGGGRNEQSDLRLILQSGYSQGTFVQRSECIGKDYTPKNFNVYGPKALGSIGSIEPTLATRCIEIVMIRAKGDSIKPSRDLDEMSPIWSNLRSDLYAWSLVNGSALLALAKNADILPPGLHNRDAQLWKPLLCIALLADQSGSQKIINRLHQYIVDKYLPAVLDNNIPLVDEVVLQELTYALRETDFTMGIQCQELLEYLRDRDQETFGAYNAQRIANLLRRYNIVTEKNNGLRLLRPSLAQLRDIKERYGFDLPLEGGPTGPVDPRTSSPSCCSRPISDWGNLDPFIVAILDYTEHVGELKGNGIEVIHILKHQGYEIPYQGGHQVIIEKIRSYQNQLNEWGRMIVEDASGRFPVFSFKKIINDENNQVDQKRDDSEKNATLEPALHTVDMTSSFPPKRGNQVVDETESHDEATIVSETVNRDTLNPTESDNHDPKEIDSEDEISLDKDHLNLDGIQDDWCNSDDEHPPF